MKKEGFLFDIAYTNMTTEWMSVCKNVAKSSTFPYAQCVQEKEEGKGEFSNLGFPKMFSWVEGCFRGKSKTLCSLPKYLEGD